MHCIFPIGRWLVDVTINFTSIYTGIAASVGLVKCLVDKIAVSVFVDILIEFDKY